MVSPFRRSLFLAAILAALGELDRPGPGIPRRSTAPRPDRPQLRGPRGRDRRPGPRPGGRGPGLADLPQPRLVRAGVGVPLPAARGRGDPELRPDGRRPGDARPALAEGRGAADLRGDRPHQARPGPARIHGPRACSGRASSRSRPGPTARSRCGTPSSAGATATWSSSPTRSATQKFTAKPIQQARDLGHRIESRDADQVALQPDATTPRSAAPATTTATVKFEAAQRRPDDRLPHALHPGRRRPRRDRS